MTHHHFFCLPTMSQINWSAFHDDISNDGERNSDGDHVNDDGDGTD